MSRWKKAKQLLKNNDRDMVLLALYAPIIIALLAGYATYFITKFLM